MNIKSIFEVMPKMRVEYYRFLLANPRRKNLYISLIWVIFSLILLIAFGLGIFGVYLMNGTQLYPIKNDFKTYMLSISTYFVLSSIMWGWCLIEIWLVKKGYYEK